MELTVGSLFAGIGGIDLGFERAGFTTLWQVEQNAYCRKVLEKNFPNADRSVTDVRDAGVANLARVDVIAGGFPCQDISAAGNRAGIDEGERSGLWREFARIIGELRPRIVFVENVAALLGRGMGRVLGDLAALGYDAEWHVVSACAVGAPHPRERVFIVAHPNSHDVQGQLAGRINPKEWQEQKEGQNRPRHAGPPGQWAVEPSVDRVAHGIPARVDRLRALGNAVVPQVVELFAHAIRKELAESATPLAM